MKKKLLVLIAFLFSSLPSQLSIINCQFSIVNALPAQRGVKRTVTQADGTKLTLNLRGDEHLHYFTADNGLPVVRKAKGSGDISGDYNTYPVNDTFEINGMKITARGTEEGYVTVIWEDGGYAYAMDMDEICMPKELLEVYIPKIR